MQMRQRRFLAPTGDPHQGIGWPRIGEMFELYPAKSLISFRKLGWAVNRNFIIPRSGTGPDRGWGLKKLIFHTKFIIFPFFDPPGLAPGPGARGPGGIEKLGFLARKISFLRPQPRSGPIPDRGIMKCRLTAQPNFLTTERFQ